MRFLIKFLILLSLIFFHLSSHATQWGIYLYLCGSDLESDNGAASIDIEEIVKAKISDDIKVVIETGGARTWQNDTVNSSKIERYVVSENDIIKVEDKRQSCMGNAETFTDFLRFCEERFPAEHKILILWDHGGGSAQGVAYDENFANNALSLKEMYDSFTSVYGSSPDKKPFDIIGFDACLMASLEVAKTCKNFGNYMVASQAIEPGNGWSYTDFLEYLSKNPHISGQDVAKLLVDSYIHGCEEYDTLDAATLSAVDLEKIDSLNMMYNYFGFEVLNKIDENDSFLSVLGRTANASENYFNSPSRGYSDMMDLGSFVRQLKNHCPESAGLVDDMLKETVIYERHGPSLNSSGLSVYYPYDGDTQYAAMFNHSLNHDVMLILNGLMLDAVPESKASAILEDIYKRLEKFVNENQSEGSTTAQNPSPSPSAPQGTASIDTAGLKTSAVEHMSSLIAAGVNVTTGATQIFSPFATAGNIVNHAANIVSAQGNETLAGTGGSSANGNPISALIGMSVQSIINPQTEAAIGTFTGNVTTNIEALENYPVTIDQNNRATLTLGPDRCAYINDVSFELFYFDEKQDIFFKLGKDAKMEYDFDRGVFYDDFDGMWACLDGNLLALEYERNDNGNYYFNVPIKYNGKDASMEIVYKSDNDSYIVKGVRLVSTMGVPNRNLYPLKKGDTITTVFMASKLSDDSDLQPVEVDTFTIADKYEIKDEEVGDCNLIMHFEMKDVKNQTAYSQQVHIEIKDNVMEYEVVE